MKIKVGEDSLKRRKIFPVHPNFRVIALATPPESANPWISHDIMHMFHFHEFSAWEDGGQSHWLDILYSIVPNLSQDIAITIHQFAGKMRELCQDPIVQLESSISLRQMIRVAKHCSIYPGDLYETLCNVCMVKFMPQAKREFVLGIMKALNIVGYKDGNSKDKRANISIQEPNILRIGSVSLPIATPKHPELVPDILFFDIARHTLHLEWMAKDFVLGEHILLIGNQGVGKNKLADRMLQLMRREREYMQLHRDTTVQSLTSTPSLVHGVIKWEDSPLVKAMEFGRVLMLDEVDKAPTEVVCILKSLIEDGEILLSDGRRYVTEKSLLGDSNLEKMRELGIRRVHPEFRVIALANPPGYPFLGNDFFAEMGDVFACHSIDNPDQESEVELLQSYLFHILRQISQFSLTKVPDTVPM
jgi:energy-coupling factor transporter ATP-binding protein EcfA2